MYVCGKENEEIVSGKGEQERKNKKRKNSPRHQDIRHDPANLRVIVVYILLRHITVI